MNFEEYLISKKIDSDAFREAEEALWLAWKTEFEQIHPNSFTVQKLNLINPIRRKYQLKVEAVPKIAVEKPASIDTNTAASTDLPSTTTVTSTPAVAKPAVPRPVFKPKPKIN